jgi:hypothetical protein
VIFYIVVGIAYQAIEVPMVQENRTQSRYISLIGDEIDQSGQKRKFPFISDWGTKTLLATAFVAASQGFLGENEYNGKELAGQALLTVAALAIQRKIWLKPEELGKAIDTRPESPPLTHFSSNGIIIRIPYESFIDHVSESLPYAVSGTIFGIVGAAAGGEITALSFAASHFQRARMHYKCALGQWEVIDKEAMRSPDIS